MNCIKAGILLMVTTCCIVVFPLGAVADQAVKVRTDSGAAIKSIVFVSLGDTNEAKGITDDSGTLLLKKPCEKGMQIKASPVNPLYYEGFVDCSPNQAQLVVKVTKKAFVQNLKWNAENFKAAGQYGNAALVYSELATRLDKIDSKEASVARNEAYVSFADAIETPSDLRVVSYDKNQGTKVLTPEFVNILKDYQRSKGLPITGGINYKTLSTQSDVSIGEALSGKIAPISSDDRQ